MRRSLSLLVLATVLCVAGTADASACLDAIIGQDINAARLADRATPDGATPVNVGIDPIDVRAVDGAAETFVADFYFWLEWSDERLTYDAAATGFERCTLTLEEAQGRIWRPLPELINLREEQRRENPFIIIKPKGEVEYSARVVGTFDANFSLTAFPFDEQELPIIIEPFMPRDEVLFAIDDTSATEDRLWKLVDDVTLPQWHIVGVVAGESENKLSSENNQAFSRYRFTLSVRRQYGYYVWKVLLPLLLIMILSWSVFWMSADSFDGQMSVSVTCVLAVIAFNFVITDDLPKIPYLTVLDSYILIAYLFVFASALENVAVNLFSRRDKQELAERIDRISRWAFPAAFVVVNVLATAAKLA